MYLQHFCISQKQAVKVSNKFAISHYIVRVNSKNDYFPFFIIQFSTSQCILTNENRQIE